MAITGSHPLGLERIYQACQEVYPDQCNPLQIAAVVKSWLGGPDPLDFINIYRNPGDPKRNIPSHWHYVTCGLTDLYGDSRVYEVGGAPDQPSGFGFELTFRLDCEDLTPPTWPAELLQSLARYMFQSDNIICVGDHISWNSPLDRGDSRIEHMLLADDPQISSFSTSLGSVHFIQIVGVTSEELSAAQQWNVQGILDLLKRKPLSGGEWLITNMRRGESLFDIDNDNQLLLMRGVEDEGSGLSGVSAVCSWEDGCGLKAAGSIITELPGMEGPPAVRGVAHCKGSEGGDMTIELLRTQTLKDVHLVFNLEAAKLIILALKGRLKHGRHFTFKSFSGDVAITFVSSGIEGAFADKEHPLASQGPWLHVYFNNSDIDTILNDIMILNKQTICLPHTFKWSHIHLSITILSSSIT